LLTGEDKTHPSGTLTDTWVSLSGVVVTARR